MLNKPKPRSVMMYGISGCSKTSQLHNMAKYIHRKTGKKLRLIHSDPGGYAPFIDSGIIDQGIVDVFDYSSRKHSLADLRRLSEGYWPRWMTPNGKECRRQFEPGLVEFFNNSDVCKTAPDEWEQIAGYLVDSLASMGEVLKAHCSDQEEGVGFKPAWKYVEEDYTLTGLQEAHYGLAQKELYNRHTKGFNNLPIDWLIYTSLVGKGEDKKGNRETVFGPQVVGNAETPKAPTWFMDCLHIAEETYMHKVNGTDVQTTGLVAWFIKHLDPNGTPFLAKARILGELMPKLLAIFPYGFVPLTYERGIETYFIVLENLRKKYQEGNHV